MVPGCCETTTTTGFGGGGFESPAAAIAALCERIETIGTETVPWDKAAGRVLAMDAVADRPSPSCDVSAMDGYALRLVDCVPGVVEVAGEILIGQHPQEMPSGKALQIVTGAPVPAGAEVVVKREDVVEHGGGSISLDEQLVSRLVAGMNIRHVGENMASGTVVPCSGRLVTAPMMGMLTGFGIAEPTVRQQVRLGMVTTGNEVVGPGEDPTQWQLRDSNAPAIQTLCDRHRWIKIETHIHACDSVDAITEAAKGLAESCDALVFTGGVSMGDHDYVPRIVESLGAQTVFHKLPQRPGKPALGAVLNGKPILGLPGNPVSVMVTAHRLLIPALAVRGGLRGQVDTPRMMRVVNGDDRTLGLWWSRLARIVGDDCVELVETKGSGDVPSSAMSDGFVELAPGQSGEGPWAFWSWS